MSYAVLAILLFSILYIYYEKKQRSIFRNYSEKVILNNKEILSENFIFENIENSTKIYTFIENEEALKSITKNVSDINLNKLTFSNFQIFKDYIKSSNPDVRIFTHMKTMYLFYPVLQEDNGFKFVVFEKDKLIFDDLMSFKTKRYNY